MLGKACEVVHITLTFTTECAATECQTPVRLLIRFPEWDRHWPNAELKLWRFIVRNESSTFRLAVCALCFLSLFGFRAYSQDQDKDRKNGHPDGIVQDWSWHHVVYPRIGPIQSLIAAQHDRRAIISWQEAEREDWHRERRRRHHRDHDHDGDDIVSDLHEDWAISLGTGSVAPAMYPAKFGFDPNALPSCPNDFV